MAWSHSQQTVVAIVPKITALFSFSGSSWIIIEVLFGTNPHDKKPKRTHPYHRLLLAMSIYDVLESIWNFASSWAIPRGTEHIFNPVGTTATCSAQGFFLTFGVAVPIYNAFLSLYYVLVVKYRMTDEMLKKKAEPWMHLFAFFWASFTAVYSVSSGLFNNANLWCWIAPYPAGCTESTPFGERGTCTRGDFSSIYRWVFYFGPLWFCIAFAGVCTVIMCTHVAGLEKRTLAFRRPERHSMRQEERSQLSVEMSRNDNQIEEIDGSDADEPTSEFFFTAWLRKRKEFAEDNPKTVQVQIQALYYLSVFFLTHVWSTSNRIVQQTTGRSVFGLTVIHSFFDPFQGFLNFIVYQRSRYFRMRTKFPDASRIKLIRRTLRFSFWYDVQSSRESRLSRIVGNSSRNEQCPSTFSRISTTGADGRTLQSIQEAGDASSSEDSSNIAFQMDVIEEQPSPHLTEPSTELKPYLMADNSSASIQSDDSDEFANDVRENAVVDEPAGAACRPALQNMQGEDGNGTDELRQRDGGPTSDPTVVVSSARDKKGSSAFQNRDKCTESLGDNDASKGPSKTSVDDLIESASNKLAGRSADKLCFL